MDPCRDISQRPQPRGCRSVAAPAAPTAGADPSNDPYALGSRRPNHPNPWMDRLDPHGFVDRADPTRMRFHEHMHKKSVQFIGVNRGTYTPPISLIFSMQFKVVPSSDTILPMTPSLNFLVSFIFTSTGIPT